MRNRLCLALLVIANVFFSICQCQVQAQAPAPAPAQVLEQVGSQISSMRDIQLLDLVPNELSCDDIREAVLRLRSWELDLDNALGESLKRNDDRVLFRVRNTALKTTGVLAVVFLGLAVTDLIGGRARSYTLFGSGFLYAMASVADLITVAGIGLGIVVSGGAEGAILLFSNEEAERLRNYLADARTQLVRLQSELAGRAKWLPSCAAR